jgi:GNAT superfamily N-acetyltransferase
MRHQVAQAAYFQWGDVLWRMYYGRNRFDLAADIRIWSDAGDRIEGFAFYLSVDHNPEFFLRPERYEHPVADELVAWAVDRARRDGATAIETSCIADDKRKAALLRRCGFEPIDDVMVFMARSLDQPLPLADLPEGYAIVSHADRPDLPGVTGTPISRGAYEQVCAAPGYRDDLGLRVCYQDREIVSGCICWYDDLDACGEFEPVGTREDHRGKGLASAVMIKTLEHLRCYDVDTAYVRTYKNNMPAVRLYQKVGFTITAEDHGWRRLV